MAEAVLVWGAVFPDVPLDLDAPCVLEPECEGALLTGDGRGLTLDPDLEWALEGLLLVELGLVWDEERAVAAKLAKPV